MYIDILIKSLIIGFIISAPIGPIGILCIDFTLNRGKKQGLIVGLGTSVANIFLTLALGLGLSFIHHIYDEYSELFRIIGGIFLCYLGLRIFLLRPRSKYDYYQNQNYLRIFLLSLILTLISPSTIILFAVIFAKLSPFSYGIDYRTILLIEIGIFTGSMLWWIILTNMVNLFKNIFKDKMLKIVNMISGLIIILFGIFTIF